MSVLPAAKSNVVLKGAFSRITIKLVAFGDLNSHSHLLAQPIEDMTIVTKVPVAHALVQAINPEKSKHSIRTAV
jgi:hypothetical protein